MIGHWRLADLNERLEFAYSYIIKEKTKLLRTQSRSLKRNKPKIIRETFKGIYSIVYARLYRRYKDALIPYGLTPSDVDFSLKELVSKFNFNDLKNIQQGCQFEIDHTKALCKFNLTDPLQLLEAFDETNLRVIHHSEHRKKDDRPYPAHQPKRV